jgi:hypothetical protein
LAGETEVLGENLPQRYFVYHKSHLTRPGFHKTRIFIIEMTDSKNTKWEGNMARRGTMRNI